MDIDALPGLREALQTDRVCSNYVDPQKTWRGCRIFKEEQLCFRSLLHQSSAEVPSKDHVFGRTLFP